MPHDLSSAPHARLRRVGSGIVLAGLAATAVTFGYRVAQATGALRRIPDDLRRYGAQLGEIAASVTGVYRGLTGLPDVPPVDAIHLIWLSDVHNNPVAYAIAKALAQQYPRAAVIDTGDIGDWGRGFEAVTFEGVGDIPAPYVFIKGNHDGPRTLVELAKHPNVVILDAGGTYRHDGLRIAGNADPRFTPDKTTGDDHLGSDRLAMAGRQLADKLSPRELDVALVHDPVVAAQLGGTVPLVLCGHTHRRSARMVDGTLVLTQGSSGGAGLRGVRDDPPQPLTISVLHVDRSTRRLHSVDELTFGGLGSTSLSLVRRSAHELGQRCVSPEMG